MLFLSWIAVAFGLPYWFSVPAGPFVPLVVVVSLLGAVSQVGSVRLRFTILDGAAVLVLLSVCSVLLLFPQAGYDASVVLAQWLAPMVMGRYLICRLDAQWLCRALAWCGAVLGAISVIELVFNWHPWVGFDNGTFAFATWAWIQERYGVPRSEWVFGHSISLGNILAMTIPFTLMARWAMGPRVISLALIFAGVLATFSRNALVAALLTLMIALYFQTSLRVRGVRVALLSVALTVGLIAAPFALNQLIGSDEETTESTSYRLLQWTLLSSVRLMGPSGTNTLLPDGQYGYASPLFQGGAARSVDSTFILLGLNLGWVPLVAVATLLILIVTQIGRARGNPAMQAVIGQLPTVATVAMITQYSSLFWLTLGMALTIYSQRVTQVAGTRRSARAAAAPAATDTTPTTQILGVGDKSPATSEAT